MFIFKLLFYTHHKDSSPEENSKCRNLQGASNNGKLPQNFKKSGQRSQIWAGYAIDEKYLRWGALDIYNTSVSGNHLYKPGIRPHVVSRSFSALRSTASWLARPSRVIRRGWQLGVIRCFYTLKTGVSLREEVSSSLCVLPPPLSQASLRIPQNDLLPWVSSFLSLRHPSELKKLKRWLYSAIIEFSA